MAPGTPNFKRSANFVDTVEPETVEEDDEESVSPSPDPIEVNAADTTKPTKKSVKFQPPSKNPDMHPADVRRVLSNKGKPSTKKANPRQAKHASRTAAKNSNQNSRVFEQLEDSTEEFIRSFWATQLDSGESESDF